MNGEILRKIKLEVELLYFIAALSTVLSVFIILDAYVVFMDFWRYGMVGSLLRLCEFVFALSWLLLSVRFTFKVQKLRRRYFPILAIGAVLPPIWSVEREEKKVDVAEVVRDMVAFYRTYYGEVKAILVLAVTVCFSIIMLATYSLVYDSLLFWDVFYRWLISVFLLLAATALYVHIHRNWGKKLMKVQNAEKRFSEMLGGPVEA